MSSSESNADKYPDFAVIWSFFSRFGRQLELENVSILDVDNWISKKFSESSCAIDIMVKLMRKTGMRVDKQRWQKYLLKATAKQDPQLAIDLQATGFDGLTFAKKLKTLKILCEMQFDENIKFKTLINSENSEDQRLKPIGRNEDGCLYWYQQDEDLNIRIYVEDQDEDDDCGWTVACRSIDDVEGLIRRLSDGTESAKKDNSDDDDSDVVETKFQKFLKSQCSAEMDEDDAAEEEQGNSTNAAGRSDVAVKIEFDRGDLLDIAPKIETQCHDDSKISKSDEKSGVDLKSESRHCNSDSAQIPISQTEQGTVDAGNAVISDKPTCVENGVESSIADVPKTKDAGAVQDKVDMASFGITASLSIKLTRQSSDEGVNSTNEKETSQAVIPTPSDSTCDDKLEPNGPQNMQNTDHPSQFVDEDVAKQGIGSNVVSPPPGSSAEGKSAETTAQNDSREDVTLPAVSDKKSDCVETGKTCEVAKGQRSHIMEGNSGGVTEEVSEQTANKMEVSHDLNKGEKNQEVKEGQNCHTNEEHSEGNETTNQADTNIECGRDDALKNVEDTAVNVSAEEMHNHIEEQTPEKRGCAPKRKRGRRRRAGSRKLPNPQKPKSETPRKRYKPKRSRIELLQKEADSILKKEQEGKESQKTGDTYRTRSGRMVKSTKVDKTDSDVWQTVPDAVVTKSEDAKDADFCYSESASKSSRCDVEITPKKRRGRPRNDTPCEKCGLYSHAATILLCDSCNKGNHMACLTPPLMAVPDGDWFCPKCSKEKLIAKLKEICEELELKRKLHERKARQTEQKKRLNEYVGISATNILPEKHKAPKTKKPQRPVKRKRAYFSSDSEDELSECDSLMNPSSPELKSVRSCRSKKVSYDFANYDRTIKDAIGEPDEHDSSDEKPISGKDIRTIVAAQKGEEAAKKLLEDDEAAKRKRHKLTDLNCSDEAAESGSNYSVSSSEAEASEDEFAGSEDLESDGSFGVGLRRAAQKKRRLASAMPVKRSKRIRRRRIQEECISSFSDSSTDYEDAPKKPTKRRARGKDSSEDEYRPPRIAKPETFIDDNDDDEGGHNEDNKEKASAEPRKISRVLKSSSEDDAPPPEKKEAAPVPAPAKQDDDVSSDDWSSLSSNAEESFEDEASADETAN